MDAEHNRRRSDGVEASFEYHRDADDSVTAKGSFRVDPESLFVFTVGVAVLLSKSDALERLLDAVPALVQRGGRLAAAA
jgi:uncharacterized membrane protein